MQFERFLVSYTTITDCRNKSRIDGREREKKI